MWLCFKNVSFWRQALVTLAAATGMFNWGTVVGWSNVANPQLRSNETGFGMDDDGSSWIGSTVPFGGIIGSLFGGKTMDLFGRKNSLLGAHILSLVGWIVIACANSVLIICIGRFFCGYASASTALIATVYIGEVVSSKHRGLFGSCLGCSVAIGIQYAVAVGAVIPTWQMTTVACLAPVLIGIILIPFMPESPYFLAWKSGDIEDARESLNWILNDDSDKVDKTLGDIKDYFQTMNHHKHEEDEKIANSNLAFEESGQEFEFQINSEKNDEKPAKKKFHWFDVKMVFIGSALMMFAMITGVPSLDYYMIEIFEASCMDLNFNVAAIIVRTAHIISTLLAIYLTDKMGRKPLLILSAFGMVVGLLILGAGFTIIDEDKTVPSVGLCYLPLIGMVIFYLTFPIGFHSVAIVLIGEIFSPSIKGIATSISTVVWWLAEFITAKIYFDFTKLLGTDGTFYLYAAISFLAIIFVQLFVRETKNKTLAEIQEVYEAKPVKLC